MPFLPLPAGHVSSWLETRSNSNGTNLPNDAAIFKKDVIVDDQDYQQTRNAVSGGIIAVIVIVAVLVFAFCIGGLCCYNRSQQGRHDRQAELRRWNANNPNPAYGASENPPAYPGAAHTHHHHSHHHHGGHDHSAGANAANNMATNNAGMGFSGGGGGGGMSGGGGI